MSAGLQSQTSLNAGNAGLLSGQGAIAETVMAVLRDIRAQQSNGEPYDMDTGLSDAGFTSVEMVKVMLGIEAAFDFMIPQDMITPENFRVAHAIAAMVEHLTQSA